MVAKRGIRYHCRRAVILADMAVAAASTRAEKVVVVGVLVVVENSANPM